MMEGRYLVLTELFLPTKGGTAVWFDAVYRRLGGKGVHVLTARVPGDEAHDRDHPNTVHRLDLARHAWLRPSSLPAYVRLFWRALRLGLTTRFDAVHAGRVLPEGLVAWVVARLLRKPVLIYAHGEEITTWRRSARRLKAMSFAYRHADRVVANSDFTRGELVALGVAPERIAVIHPGVDLDRFHPGHEAADLLAAIGCSQGQRLILSVGRLSRRKGFDQVIAALAQLLEAGIDAHYAIIGIGEDAQHLRALGAAQGVSGRVHFLGHVAPADLPRWYCAADVFAMPNREIDGDTEGFGMVFIEAAACGTPAVAGRAGGTGAAVQDGVTGLRVDGERLDDVVDALARLLGDDALRLGYGEQGRQRALREFSWDMVAMKTAALAPPNRS